MYIEWDLETTPLQVKTTSKAGSGELLWLNFDTITGTREVTGGFGLDILFSDPPKYMIKFCHDPVEFSLPDVHVHVWTFAKTDCCVVIHVNGVLIVKYDIGLSRWQSCQGRWSHDVETFKFVSSNFQVFDNASISYRVQPKG